MQREGYEHWVTVNFKLPWNFPSRNFRKTAERTLHVPRKDPFPGFGNPRGENTKNEKWTDVFIRFFLVPYSRARRDVSLLNQSVSISRSAGDLQYL